MSGRLILCPPPERATTDGTRPGPCHIYGRCPDLNICEPRKRCHAGPNQDTTEGREQG